MTADHRKSRRVILFALRLCIGGSTCALLAGDVGAQTNADPVAYELAPQMAGKTITGLAITVRFQAGPSGTTRFGWSEAWAGERRLSQWVRDFRVSGAGSVEHRDEGQWRITARPGARLVVRYRIVSAYEHDPTVEDSRQAWPVIRPGWFYAAGEALFGVPEGAEYAPATFDWQGEPGIGIATDLEHLAGQARAASRPGVVTDVVESVVAGGRDIRIFPPQDGSSVRVAVIGLYAFSPDRLNELAHRIVGMEREFWQSDRGSPFLVTAAPIVGSATITGFSGTGRGDAFALWLDPKTPSVSAKWLLAHEYFHTWNPSRLGASSADRQERLAQSWFSEGFTDYYARALLVRAGLVSPAQFAGQWNEMLRAYAQSPVRNMAGVETAAAFWSNDNVRQLAYQRGAMLAAMWNARLLAASDRRVNLDTLLHEQRVEAGSQVGSPVVLFRAIAARHGLSTAGDEKRYLDRGETIALPPDTFGPCAKVQTLSQPRFSVGFVAEDTAKAGNTVTGVDPGHPAFAAGLRNGMTVLARKGGEAGNALVPYVLQVRDKARQRIISYLPQTRQNVSIQQVVIESSSPKCRASLGGSTRH